MWRKLLKILLYSSLVIGTLEGLSIMMDSDAVGFGFVMILVVWLSASVFGLVLEIATDTSKIAASNETIKDLLQNSSFTALPQKVSEMQVTETELEEKKPVVEEEESETKLSSTWTCKCGKENPLKNNFCTECGEKKP